MLGKLLKHEIKAMGRIMLPLYVVMIFASLLFAFNMRMNMSGMAKVIAQRFAILTGFLFAAAVLTVCIVMVIIVIQRFHKNLLGTEGYLMFTLPVRTHELILSKVISSFLWIVIGIAAGFAAGFLMIDIVSSVPEFLRQVREIWSEISLNKTAAAVIWFIIMFSASLIEALCKVYAAIAAGHQFHGRRLAGSVLCYVLFGMAEMLLGFLFSRVNILSARGGLFAVTAGNSSLGIRSMQIGTLVAVVGIVVYGLLCWYLLDRRLNLE